MCESCAEWMSVESGDVHSADKPESKSGLRAAKHSASCANSGRKTPCRRAIIIESVFRDGEWVR